MSDSDSTVDLLVFGGGMAGMSAAARACSDGASVVLVEKGPAIGGSAVYAGFIWTAPTVEVMREVNPDADPALSARVVEQYGEALDWVRSLDVSVADPVTVLGYGRGSATDMANYLLTCDRIVREQGEVLVGSSATRLLVEDGAVVGAEIETGSGEQRVIRARSTLLATGGFGGDPALRAEHISPLAADLPLRANTHSVGDGLKLGLSVGAAFGPPNSGFYGHLIPSKVAYNNPYEFTDLTFYHSEHGVLLNLEGNRFCDETIGDHLNTLYVLDQPEARALLVYDQRVHDEWEMAPYVEGVEPLDKFQLAYRRGARAAVADDIDEFEALPEEWGYPGPASRDTLYEFNRQCEAGAPTPPRKLDAAPLVTPPYYIIEVIPAITFTFSGLRIDPQARVLDESGQVIPGLLAAGADAGGVFHRGYAGGLACALVFGLQAAATATAERTASAVGLAARAVGTGVVGADPLRVGIVLREQDLGAWSGRLGELASHAVDAGIDHLTVGDHVSFADGHGADGLIQATALLSAHPRLSVQTGVYLIALRHPAVVARQLATIALLAPGRFTFGVGVGGDDPSELELCGINPRERGALDDRGAPLPAVVHAGRARRVPRAVLRPPRSDPSDAVGADSDPRGGSVGRRARAHGPAWRRMAGAVGVAAALWRGRRPSGRRRRGGASRRRSLAARASALGRLRHVTRGCEGAGQPDDVGLLRPPVRAVRAVCAVRSARGGGGRACAVPRGRRPPVQLRARGDEPQGRNRGRS